jgi:membrane protease YdiL (CAAX protease family)
MGFSLVIMTAGFMAQALVAVLWAVVLAATGQTEALRHPDTFRYNGLLLALATLAGTPLLAGLSLLFAWLRKGIPIKQYLGFSWPGLSVMGRWSLWLILIIVASDSTSSLLGRPVVAEFMIEAWKTAGFLPLLWFILLVAAPLGEELLFRGFMFTGLQSSGVGNPGAIIISAFVWAVIHIQYDVYGMGLILLGGLFLGFVRMKTNSVWICVCLHALMNLIATVEVAVYLNCFPG